MPSIQIRRLPLRTQMSGPVLRCSRVNSSRLRIFLRVEETDSEIHLSKACVGLSCKDGAKIGVCIGFTTPPEFLQPVVDGPVLAETQPAVNCGTPRERRVCRARKVS